MKKHKKIKGPESKNSGYSQLSIQASPKRTTRILIAGVIIYTAIAGFYGVESSPAKNTKPQKIETHSNTTRSAPASSELASEQEITALKKEELGLAEMLMRDFPNSIDPVILMGNLWERHGDTAKALEYYNKALEQNPKRADVYKVIGWFFMHTEQYDKAIGYWQKALEIDPNIVDLRNNIALAFMGQNEQSKAIEELEKEIKVSPRSSFSYFLLGQLYLRQQEYEKAGNNYKKAIEIQPDYTNAYYGLFTLYSRLKQRDKAAEYMSLFKKFKADDMKILKDRDEAFDDLVDMQKGATETYLLAGKMYQDGGNFQKAEEILNKAITFDPNNVQCLERLISLYLTTNRPTNAIALCRKISEINPKNPLCHLNLGILSMQLNQFDNAEKAFRKVIEVAPGLSRGYRELAQLYLQTGKDFPEAGKLAKKAVALEPNALNYFVLSWACDKNGDTKNALKAITKAIQLEPTNPRYRNVYEHIRNRK